MLPAIKTCFDIPAYNIIILIIIHYFINASTLPESARYNTAILAISNPFRK